MTITDLNNLDPAPRAEALARCCGATAWVEAMNDAFPMKDEAQLFEAANVIWYGLKHEDWLEAFTHHPKIGDVTALKEKFASTAKWAEGEQGAMKQATDAVIQALAEGNAAYEQKFGYIFIVCATGKSADEMVALLQERLPNAPDKEIHIAMAEQDKITRIRLEKLLAS